MAGTTGQWSGSQPSAAGSSQLLVHMSGTPRWQRRHQHHHWRFLSTSENLAFETILCWSYHLICRLCNSILTVRFCLEVTLPLRHFDCLVNSPLMYRRQNVHMCLVLLTFTISLIRQTFTIVSLGICLYKCVKYTLCFTYLLTYWLCVLGHVHRCKWYGDEERSC